jgi:ribosomal protein L12E/L44/L45/RPP1/RPP2
VYIKKYIRSISSVLFGQSMDKQRLKALITSLQATGHAEMAKSHADMIMSATKRGGKTKKAVKRKARGGKNTPAAGDLFEALMASIQTNFGQMFEEYNRANFDMMCKLMTDFIASMSCLAEGGKRQVEYDTDENYGWDEDEEEEDEEEDGDEDNAPSPKFSPAKRKRKLPSGPPAKKRTVRKNESSSMKNNDNESIPQNQNGDGSVVPNVETRPPVSMGGSNSAFVSVLSNPIHNNNTVAAPNLHPMSPSPSSSQLMMPGNVSVSQASPSTMSYVHQMPTSGSMFTI